MPLLIEHTVGQGKVYLFTSTIDDEAGNLPLQATFLPLVQRSIAQLGGASGSAVSGLKALWTIPFGLTSGAVTDLVVDDQPVRSPQKTRQCHHIYPSRTRCTHCSCQWGPPGAGRCQCQSMSLWLTGHRVCCETAAAIEPEAFTKRVPLFPYLLWLALALALQAWLAWQNQEDSDVIHA